MLPNGNHGVGPGTPRDDQNVYPRLNWLLHQNLAIIAVELRKHLHILVDDETDANCQHSQARVGQFEHGLIANSEPLRQKTTGSAIVAQLNCTAF